MPKPDVRAFVSACLLAVSADAAEPAPLFADDAVLEVRIEAPIKVLMEVRPNDADVKGMFVFKDLDGEERRMRVKLRTRGNYRRDKSHCDFAPIRLNFPKNEVYGTLLETQDKLKLVTHCRSRESEFERYLLREYLAYRLFSELSEASYKVRLLRITYYDSQEGDQLTRYGFVIEDDKAAANRSDMKLVKVRQVANDDHDPARENLVHLFQFMIGNTEYSLTSAEPDKKCCHNVDLMSATKEPPFIALPFDFDFSGLVGASYAEPNPRYPIKLVQTRFYKGRCANNALLPETLALFQRKRKDLFAIIDTVASLDKKAERAAHRARSYIESFYDAINDPEEIRKRLVENCDETS